MRVLNLCVELRLTEAGISLSADTDSNEKRAVATGQRIMTFSQTKNRIMRLLAILV